MASGLVWSGDDEFSVDGVRYLAEGYVGTKRRADPDQLRLLKPRAEIEAFVARVEASAPRTIVELGIYHGGSTALLAQVAQPRTLVALDLRPDCPPLDRFIERQGLGGVVLPHYGVDQADAARLDEIMANALGGAPVDMVIDDASHLLPETVASFNRLFPHLRPGGSYVIEDWSWAHSRLVVPPDRYQGVPPLSAFVCELVLAAASRPAVVAEVVVDAGTAVVVRGHRELDPTRFDISAHFDPVARDMVDRISLARTLTQG